MARDDLLTLFLDQLRDGLAEVRAAAREARDAALEAQRVLAPLPERLTQVEGRLMALERGGAPETGASAVRAVVLQALPLAVIVAGGLFGAGLSVAVGVIAWARPEVLLSLLGASHALPTP